MNLLFPQGVEFMFSFSGWDSLDAVTAYLVINYPGAWPDMFTAPTPLPPPSVVTDVFYTTAPAEIPGRVVTNGKCYSDPIVWNELPDDNTYNFWGSGFGPDSPFTSEAAAIEVFGVALMVAGGGIPLFYSDEVGATGIAQNGYPPGVPVTQDITLDPGGMPWFELGG